MCLLFRAGGGAGMEMNKHDYKNDGEIESNEIQKCQEYTSPHFPNYDSVEESRRERQQMSNQL